MLLFESTPLSKLSLPFESKFQAFLGRFLYLNLDFTPPLSSLLNLDVGNKPTGNSSSGTAFQNWGEWIVDTAGLDKTKWKVNGTGIEPIYQFDAKTPASSQGCGAVITITPAAQNNPPNITFDPDQINGNNANNSLCKKRGEI